MNVLPDSCCNDIGKTQIAPELVNKNGKLSKIFVQIKKHVELGAILLKQLGGLDESSLRHLTP